MKDDNDCVREVLAGDKEAYGFLIHKYKDKIYTLLLRMIHDAQDAQDLTQECFIKAYHYLHSFDPERKFSSWLYRIATNLCLNALQARQKNQRHPAEWDDEWLIDESSPEAILLQKEHISEIRDVIQELPEHYRIVLLLRYLEDMSYQEISAVLEVPVSTVQVRLHRAKLNLRTRFQSSWKGGKPNEVF
ncbi:RNA polymerase sigma factor [Brevibacillus sp. GCM10020057]|uniref:RNA polymerase sigma factor n=1 Tax=Brevibacillus sp. GCM10020057 TaxID=3317327 RepID=UPI0036444DED